MEPMTILFIISLILSIIGAISFYIWRRGKTDKREGDAHQSSLGIDSNAPQPPKPVSKQDAAAPPTAINDELLADYWENGYITIHSEDFLRLEEKVRKEALDKVEAALEIMNSTHNNEDDPQYLKLQAHVASLRKREDLASRAREDLMSRDKFNSLMTEHQDEYEHTTSL